MNKVLTKSSKIIKCEMKDDRDETLIGLYEIDLKNIDFNVNK